MNRILFWFFSLFLSLPLTGLAHFRSEVRDVPVTRDAGYWVSEWREVHLPEGLESFQILSFGSEEVYHQLTDVIAPSGDVYVRSDIQIKGNPYSHPIIKNAISLNRTVSVIKGFSSAIIPNNPILPSPPAGVWKFRVFFHQEPQDKTVSFLILGKEKTIIPQTSVRAKIWIAPDSFWSKDAEHLEQVIAASVNHFAEAGVRLNIVATEILPEKVSEGIRIPDDVTAIAKRHNQEGVANIYLLPTMAAQRVPINGFACIAAPIKKDLQHPCFVSLYADVKTASSVSVKAQAKVLTHELAHYLGLFHTVETGYVFINQIFDVFEDTPQSNSGTNMMDTGLPSTTPTFSPLQKKILLLSPALGM